MNTNDYIEVICNNVNEDALAVIIALLSDVGFEGFEEKDDILKAYTSKEDFNELFLDDLAKQYSFSYHINVLSPQNWNAVWEQNFEPVIIDDFVTIRAHFHQPITTIQYEVVITPKMSFGTGHHATTTMMIQQMRNLDFFNKTVLDFGTGTGILAILAEKLGAASMVAVDNDAWSIENSRENVEQNHCHLIEVLQREDANLNKRFDIIVANINRNVILDNLAYLSSQLQKGGYLLLSGLLEEDEKVILAKTNDFQLVHVNTLHRLQWISLLFSR
jgi:ribosomal protein L11 methyltransferase